MKQKLAPHHLTLNEKQLEAVTPLNGTFLVRAGAGSGKTRVITARIIHLIEHGVAPHAIVALTFTNKAAREMKERVQKLLPAGLQTPYIGTFHAYCLRILKINRHFLEHPDFTMLDGDDQETVIKNILKRYGLTKQIAPRTVLAAISQQKNALIRPQMFNAAHISDPLMRQIYSAYEQEKKVSHCFDFDDLLLETLRLFQTDPRFKQEMQKAVRHILVDEYQDTNLVQHALLQEMALSADLSYAIDSLCVVGDEDQSIYSWRGATISNIINFSREFPNARAITIDQNYRSVQPILTTANYVIEHNTERNPKKLWSDRPAEHRVQLITCASQYQESMIAAEVGKYLHKKEKLNTLAILYRSHYQSRSIEEALIRARVPYKIIGGTQFYDRQEIKDILAYLRLAHNPFDRIALIRAMSTPSRGLGDKFLEQLFEFWDPQPFSTWHDIAQRMIKESIVTGAKERALQKFMKLFEAVNSTKSALEAAELIIQKTEFYDYLVSSFEEQEATARKQNVHELLAAIKSLESQNITTLSQFLDEVALLQEHTTAQEHDCVKLMTLHSAKGLEFDTIILTGLEEGILPSGHALYQPETVEEERRLLYVGITRARERLIMLWSKYRSTYGKITDQRPSRFLQELPSLVQSYDASQWHQTQCTGHVASFMQGQAEHTVAYKTSEKPVKKLETSSFKKHQPIKHATFGTGIIEKIDSNGRLTVRFKSGVKKIDAKFVLTA